MIIPENRPFLTPGKLTAMIGVTFTLGIVMLIGLVIVAIIAAAYLLTIAVSAVNQFVTQVSILYTTGGPLVQLVLLLTLLCFTVKLTPYIARFVCPALVK